MSSEVLLNSRAVSEVVEQVRDCQVRGAGPWFFPAPALALKVDEDLDHCNKTTAPAKDSGAVPS